MQTRSIRLSGFAAATLAVALCSFALAWLAILYTRGNDRVAAVWLANAVVAVILLRRPAREQQSLIPVAISGVFTANIVAGDALLRALGLCLSNAFEIALFVRLMRPVLPLGARFDRRPVIARFLAAALVAPLASTIPAGFLLSLDAGLSLAPFLEWYASDTLGLLVVVPLMLTARRSRRRVVGVGPAEEAAIVAGIVVLGGVLLYQQVAPLLFLICPVLAIAAFRVRLFASMVALTLVAVEAVMLTALGHGLIARVSVPGLQPMVVQAFIAAMVLLLLPMRAAMSERDTANDAVLASERKFLRIAEASPAGILHVTSGGVPTFANRRWEELTGRGPLQLDAGNWLDLVAEEERDPARRLWARCRAMAGPGHGEFRFHRPDGREGWAELSIYPQRDANGAEDGFVVRLSDVSDRRAIAIALQEREALYRLVTENVRDLVLRLAPDGRVLYASSSARSLLGIEPSVLLGNRLRDAAHEDDHALLDTILDPSRGSGLDRTAAFRMRHQDGHYRWVEASYRRLQCDRGESSELVMSLRDIDERRRSELAAADASAQMRESNRLLVLAESLARVGHWRFDLATNLLDHSGEFNRLLGLPLDATLEVGQALGLVQPSSRRDLFRALARGRRGHVPAAVTLYVGSASGDMRHFQLMVQADRGADGAIRGLIGVIHETTQQARSRAALVAARDEARAAAESKSLFLATMSHEIRTPMTGVLGMIDLLRADPSNDERGQYLATLKQSADLLMAVLDDILDFSKIEAGTLDLEEQDVDLGALMRATVDLFKTTASRKGLLLDLDMPADIATGVRCDPVRFQQILSNLLSNAIKFTEQGTVRLVATVSPGPSGRRCWRFEVIDSGIGITPDQRARLFEPFVQADISTSRRFGGTGLGLAISRRLVSAMGGSIGVDSEVGRGSRFWIEVTLDDGQPVARPALPGGTGPSRPLSVLVAEDNPVNQLLINALLRRDGHEVTCVEDGRGAVNAASIRHFDCILMDMQMPEMDGLAATRAIRGGGGPCAHVPIIALTADASPERRRFYDGAGLTDFMTKPIDQRALSTALAALAGRDSPCRPQPSSDSGSDRDAALPLLETGMLEELAASLGMPRLLSLLEVLGTECENRSRVISRLVISGDVTGARTEAHSLKGASGSLGALALADAARTIEVTGDDPGLVLAADALCRVAAATLDAIGDWSTTHAGPPAVDRAAG